MHQLAFGGSAHGWIAGLPGDAIQVECEQCRVQPQASTGDGGFAARVTAPDDDHVEHFREGCRGAHASILSCYGSTGPLIQSTETRTVRSL